MGYQTRRRRMMVAVALNVVVAAVPCFGDDIGLSAFQADTHNAYLGQGIVVAQPEASFPAFEIDPAAAGVSVPITYIYLSNGTSGNLVTTSSLSANYTSGHAATVAGNLAGTAGGVAPKLSTLLNYDADLYVNYYVLRDIALFDSPKVINQSFIETTNATFTDPIIDQFFDNYVAQNHYIICTAAGNGGDIQTPGTAYNVITVGASNGGASVSQPGQLCKPDIVAPGGATSYATPYVSGAAALLVQVAGSGDGTDPRVVKSLLLNGATIPAGWSHSPTQPLDRTYGAGIVNIDASYRNLIGGEYHAGSITYTPTLGGAHAPASTGNVGATGWDLGSLISTSNSDAVANYVIDLSQDTSIFNFTATLTWQRANDQALTDEYLANANNPNFTNFTSSVYTINNLDLYLYNVTTGQQVDLSISAIDNVEHLVTVNLPPGKYDLQVLKNGGAVGTANVFSNSETYGLAWNAGNQTAIINSNNLLFSQTNSVMISTAITGAGTLTQTGVGTTTLTAAVSYTGPTVIGAGQLTFSGGVSHSVGGISGTGALVVDSNTTLTSDGVNLLNGRWIINGTQVIRSSAIGGAYALFAGGGGTTTLSGTSVTSNLTFGAGAHLDLNNNALIVEATSANKSSLLAQIAGDVTSGAITSSTALTQSGWTLVVADNGALGAKNFGGAAVDSNSIIVTEALLGDANLDGYVDLNDFNIWLSNLGKPGAAYSVTGGDLNVDGNVDLSDFNFWLSSLGHNLKSNSIQASGASLTLGGLSGTAGGATAAPEPASMSLLALGAAAMLIRRKRRS